MKTLSKFLIITAAFVFSSSHDLQAFESKYAQEVREIEKLESKQSWKAAAIYSANLSLKIGQDIKINGVVVSDKLSLNGSISENSDQFDDKLKKKRLSLEKKLSQYLVKQEENLWQLKMSTVKALQLSLKLSQTEQEEIAVLMSRAVRANKEILFYGELDIKFCSKTTTYINHIKTKEREISNIGVLGDRFNSTIYEDYPESKVFTDKTCEEVKGEFNISVDDAESARLNQADLLIRSYEKQVSLPDFAKP